MKIRRFLCVGAVISVLLSGCGKEADKEDCTPEAVYGDPIAKYVEAIVEKWPAEKYRDEGLNETVALLGEGEAAKRLGYAFRDLDGDGSPELLIGFTENTEDETGLLLDMYTLKNGAPVQLAVGGERNRYYLLSDGKVLNIGSSSAMQTAYFIYELSGGTWICHEGILYDSTIDPQNPWYRATDDSRDPSRGSVIEESEAQNLLDEYESRRENAEYQLFIR